MGAGEAVSDDLRAWAWGCVVILLAVAAFILVADFVFGLGG
jgi:hypothetical protein